MALHFNKIKFHWGRIICVKFGQNRHCGSCKKDTFVLCVKGNGQKELQTKVRQKVIRKAHRAFSLSGLNVIWQHFITLQMRYIWIRFWNSTMHVYDHSKQLLHIVLRMKPILSKYLPNINKYSLRKHIYILYNSTFIPWFERSLKDFIRTFK